MATDIKQAILSHFNGQWDVFYSRFVRLPKADGEVKIRSPFRHETIPSFTINLTGEHAGEWFDFGNDEKGDCFDFFIRFNRHLHGRPFPDVLKEMATKFDISIVNGYVPPAPTGKAGDILSAAKALGRNTNQEKKKYTTYPLSWIDQYHQALLKNEHGSLDYVRDQRGLSMDTIARFQLGVGIHRFKDENDKEASVPCLIIPYICDGRIVLVKKRSLPPHPKAFFREAGMESALFNYGSQINQKEALYICEAELDAISLWEAGFKNTISVPTGAKHFKNEWIGILEPFPKIVMCYDDDEAGREGRREIRQRLGEERIWSISFNDQKDANAVLVASGKESLRDMVNSAIPTPINSVEFMGSIIDDLMVRKFAGDEIDLGYEWQFPILTKKLGRINPGNLIEVSGVGGIGKSILCTNTMVWLAKELKIPSLICCLEMTPHEQVTGIIQAEFGVTEEQITIETLQEAAKILPQWPLYFEYHNEEVSVDDIIATFDKAYRRYGVKVFLMDNLGLLSRANPRDILAEEGRVSRQLKLWAQRTNNTVILIVHPRKMERGRIEGAEDTRGNSAVHNDGDLIVTLWRQNLSPETDEDLLDNPEQEDKFHPVTAVLQKKARHGGGGGRAWLFCEGEYRRFRLVRSTDAMPVVRDTKNNKGKKTPYRAG